MFICFSVTGVHMFLVLITSSTMPKRSTDASEMLCSYLQPGVLEVGSEQGSGSRLLFG